MAQTQNTSYDGWIGRDAYDSAGEKIGEITDIYYDDRTGRPEWLAIKSGLFGSNSTFVPIHGSQVHKAGSGKNDEDSLRLAFDKDLIKNAPNIDPEGHMSPEEEKELWTYWGYDYTSDSTTDHGYGTRYQYDRADKDFVFEPPTLSQRREVGAIGNVGTERMEEVTEEVPVKTTAQVEVPVDTTVRLRRYQTQEQKTKMVEIPYTETTEHTEVADVQARAGSPTTTKGAAQVGTSKPRGTNK
jgi:hypothetical protein